MLIRPPPFHCIAYKADLVYVQRKSAIRGGGKFDPCVCQLRGYEIVGGDFSVSLCLMFDDERAFHYKRWNMC